MKYTRSNYDIAIDEYKQKRYKEVIENFNEYLNADKKNGIDTRGLFTLAKSYEKLKLLKDSNNVYKTANFNLPIRKNRFGGYDIPMNI